MSKKPMSFDQWAEFLGKVMYALPRDMDSATVQRWIDDPDALTAMLHANLMDGGNEQIVSAIPQHPADGLPFDLTIESFAGIDLVGRFGFDNQRKWKFNGKEVTGPQTKKFKLVSIGAQPNFEAVKAALVKYGAIPEGQWLDAFKKAFPRPDGNGPIGVADSSWVPPNGDASFPYVDTDGDAYFYWTGNDFNAAWRWLVGVQA